MESEWKWGDEIIDTPEMVEGKKRMLNYLILHSHFSSMEDFNNNREGWPKEELQEELDKLNKQIYGEIPN